MTTRINQNAGAQYLSSRPVSDSKGSQASKAGAAAPSPGADRVSLSAQADRLSQLSQIAAASPDIDSAKIESLRNAIADGSYKVDADSLANSMLTADRLLGR